MMGATRRCAKWLFALAMIGTVSVTCVRAVYSAQDMKKVTTMTEKMKTVCVGRYLIDLPEEAVLRMKMPQVDGFDIARREETTTQYLAWLSQREAALGAKPNMLGRKNIESIHEVRGDNYVGKIFAHSRYRTSGTENGRQVFYESVSLEGSIHSNGATFIFNSEGDSASRIPALESMMRQLRNRTENEIPKIPGFCIDRALLADPAEKGRNENVVMVAGLPNHPDFGLLFWTNTARIQGAGLIERKAAAMDALTRARTRVLRERTRTINGLDGEEVALKVTELNFATVFGFEWETRGSGTDLHVPQLTLELQTGLSPRSGAKPVQSSLSEEAVTTLWERISSSIRLRPTSAIEVARTEPPILPLGTCAEAGERCPQSGWWLCGDGGDGIAVLGGQRQYFTKGQKLPQALLLPPQSLWQKVRGLQPSYESRTRTAWTLVDKRERDRTAPTVPLAQATLVAKADSSSAIDSARSCAEPGVSIGCIARTGMQCPASGWWRCEESHALDGTRWFAAGSLLPAATFEVSAATLGRAFGSRQVIQRRSVWQLVRQSSEPGEDLRPSPDDGDPPMTA